MIYVIIPIYNGEKFIKSCLDSLLKQTEKDFLAICVNDGSKDKSDRLVADYCKKDNRFILIDKENGGLASARNAGLNYIKKFDYKDFICFLDIDDYFNDDYLEVLKKELEINRSDIVCSSTTIVNYKEKFIDPHNNVKRNQILTSYKALVNLYTKVNLSFYMCCRLYRAALFKDVRFIETTRIFEDVQTLYKVFHNANNVSFLPYSGYNYVMNPDSLLHKKTSNKAILSLLTSYLEAYEYDFSRFDIKEKKLLKKKIAKEFGRLYVMYMHNFDFRNLQNEERIQLYNIKTRINVKKSVICSNVYSLKDFLKKIIFLILGEKKYSRL